MPVFLSFIICSALLCKTVVPNPEPFPGLAACQRAGQLLAMEWQKPGWTVSRVRCTFGTPPPAEDDS